MIDGHRCGCRRTWTIYCVCKYHPERPDVGPATPLLADCPKRPPGAQTPLKKSGQVVHQCYPHAAQETSGSARGQTTISFAPLWERFRRNGRRSQSCSRPKRPHINPVLRTRRQPQTQARWSFLPSSGRLQTNNETCWSRILCLPRTSARSLKVFCSRGDMHNTTFRPSRQCHASDAISASQIIVLIIPPRVPFA